MKNLKGLLLLFTFFLLGFTFNAFAITQKVFVVFREIWVDNNQIYNEGMVVVVHNWSRLNREGYPDPNEIYQVMSYQLGYAISTNNDLQLQTAIKQVGGREVRLEYGIITYHYGGLQRVMERSQLW